MFGLRKTARALIDMGERRSVRTANREVHYHYQCCCAECPRRADAAAEPASLGIASGTGWTDEEIDRICAGSV